METTFTHKCPNCGGPLLFNPKDQKFHCEYCLNIYTEEEVTRYEQAEQKPEPVHCQPAAERPAEQPELPEHAEQEERAAVLIAPAAAGTDAAAGAHTPKRGGAPAVFPYGRACGASVCTGLRRTPESRVQMAQMSRESISMKKQAAVRIVISPL